MGDDQVSIDLDLVRECLLRAYDLGGELTRLPGENLNYRVETRDGDRYIFKLSGEGRPPKTLELEQRVLKGLETVKLDFLLPRTIDTLDGTALSEIPHSDGLIIYGCLQNHLDGTPWGSAGQPYKKQLRDLGLKLAGLDLALSDLQEKAAQRTHRWDLTAVSQHQTTLALLADPEKRQIAERMMHLYSTCAQPHLKSLPHSLIHGDANDENLLVEAGVVIGLLDFGDCLNNPTICELAITLAYVMLEQMNPLAAGAEVVAGYHSVRVLSQPELDVLYPLICGRLCTTVLIAADRRRIDPEHPTWFSTEERAWRLLEKLENIDPAEARDQLSSG